MSPLRAVLVSLTMHALYTGCDGQSIEDAQILISNLTSDYDVRIRPVKQQHEALVITITSKVISIQSFDDITGIATYRSRTMLEWIDKRMVWDASEYQNLRELQLPLTDIWRPSLVMLNSPDYNFYQPCQYMDKARVNNRGLVTLQCIDIVQTMCLVDITYFPFDSQSCPIDIIPWGYMSTEVELELFDTDANETNSDLAIENGAWDYEVTGNRIDTSRSDGYALQFSIRLKRRQTFTVVNLILPILILAFINTWVFLLPPGSGERTSFSMTVLLTFVVYMGILNDNVPKGSEPLAQLSILLSVTLFYSVSVLLCTIVSLRMYDNVDKKPVPRLVQRLTYYLSFGACTHLHAKNTVGVNGEDRVDSLSGGIKSENSPRNDTTSHCHDTSETNSFRTGIHVTWDTVGGTVDAYAFIIHVIWWVCLVVAVVRLD